MWKKEIKTQQTELQTLPEYRSLIDAIVKQESGKLEIFSKAIARLIGISITPDMTSRVITKMFGAGVRFGGLSDGYKARVVEYFVLRFALGFNMSADGVKNLDKIRETSGTLVEMVRVSLNKLMIEGREEEILKYIPQSVWQDYFLASVAAGGSNNAAVDKLTSQLPVVANAELRKVEKLPETDKTPETEKEEPPKKVSAQQIFLDLLE